MFDQSEFKFDEESSMYGPRDSGQCATEKDTIERLQNTAGIFLAVSFCGVVLQAQELYRSEGKQQVALFLMDLICAYHEMGVLLPIAICYDACTARNTHLLIQAPCITRACPHSYFFSRF